MQFCSLNNLVRMSDVPVAFVVEVCVNKLKSRARDLKMDIFISILLRSFNIYVCILKKVSINYHSSYIHNLSNCEIKA